MWFIISVTSSKVLEWSWQSACSWLLCDFVGFDEEWGEAVKRHLARHHLEPEASLAHYDILQIALLGDCKSLMR